jgi:alpha/beta superfamily hydrolase
MGGILHQTSDRTKRDDEMADKAKIYLESQITDSVVNLSTQKITLTSRCVYSLLLLGFFFFGGLIAEMPVMARPETRIFISYVPSYVWILSMSQNFDAIPLSNTTIPLPPSISRANATHSRPSFELHAFAIAIAGRPHFFAMQSVVTRLTSRYMDDTMAVI